MFTDREIDLEFVRRVDAELINSDMPLYARPFHVIRTWMQENRVSGNIFDEALTSSVLSAYKQLYPSGDFALPPLSLGGVAFADQWYFVRIPVAYGNFRVDPLDAIEIPRSELEEAWKRSPENGWRAFYSVADLYDFGFSLDDLHKTAASSPTLWDRAAASLCAASSTLRTGYSIDDAIQSAHLAAETAIKGTLNHLGVNEARRRELGHSLPALADELISLAPRANASRLKDACDRFPAYVTTRYERHGLSTAEIMRLAMRAQYVAAEALRCVSDRNLAEMLKNDPATPPRPRI